MIRRQIKRGGPTAAGLLAIGLCLSACGGDNDSGGQAAGAGAPTTAQPAAPAGTPAAPAGTPAANAGGGAAVTFIPGTEPIIEAITLLDWYRVLLVNPAAIADPRELEGIARPYCDGLETCRIGIWYDEADFPRELPVPNYRLNKQVFAFGRTLTGAENALWNCDVFPQLQAPGQCLPRGID
jgi:hypothetical protein